MKLSFIYIVTTSLIIIFTPLLQVSNASLDNNKMEGFLERSLVHKGNTERLQHVMSRARRGKDIVIGVIGGSITKGTGASKPDDRWGNLVYRWWKETFPKSNISFVNAGIGGTGSAFGAHRVTKDLLKYKPDFVIAEFAVNDRNNKSAAETLEGMTRQILKKSNAPALLLLFTTYENGRSAQEWHSKIGLHYGLPMMSYRDAVWPELEEGHLKWENIAIDKVHPNSRGHRYCAEIIKSYLNSILVDLPDNKNLSDIPQIPKPLISNTFEYTSLYQNGDIIPVKNRGWKEVNGGWQADQPGSEIEFIVTGRVISVMFNRLKGDMGIAEVTVDNYPPVKLNGWFSQPWKKKQIDIIARDLEQGNHILRIKLLKDRAMESNGHEFVIHAIMAAGLSQ